MRIGWQLAFDWFSLRGDSIQWCARVVLSR
jgi:hypothetical protein